MIFEQKLYIMAKELVRMAPGTKIYKTLIIPRKGCSWRCLEKLYLILCTETISKLIAQWHQHNKLKPLSSCWHRMQSLPISQQENIQPKSPVLSTDETNIFNHVLIAELYWMWLHWPATMSTIENISEYFANIGSLKIVFISTIFLAFPHRIIYF